MGGGAKYNVEENVEAGQQNITVNENFRDCTADFGKVVMGHLL